MPLSTNLANASPRNGSYAPYLNQFQSRDPFPGYAKLPQSQNGFSYVGNNPTNYIDPLGLRRCTPQELALDFETCDQNQPLTGSSNLFNYNVIPGSPGGSVIAYLQVNYQTLPWREYAKPQAPGYSRLIPVRHPLDLREEYPDCGLGFEEVMAVYSNGNFYVWEVNARNIMASLNSVIANQKPYALRDAIGIAYAPYNRQRAGWTGYMGKNDPLSLLLAGGDNFEVSANSERYSGAYTAPFKGTGYSHDVYYFSLVVAYGVHYEYFYDTSYGASEYRHRPDEESNSEIVCGGDGPAFFMHPGTRFNDYQYKWTTEELEARGGWTLPVLEMPWPTADSWISPYPPVGCVSQR